MPHISGVKLEFFRSTRVDVSGASRGMLPDAYIFHRLSTHWNLGKKLNLVAIMPTGHMSAILGAP